MNPEDKPENVHWGDWVTLKVDDEDIDTDKSSNKSVVCRILGEDRFFGAAKYGHIYINKHHRNILGVEVGEYHTFSMTEAPSWCFFWYIYRYHPDNTKRAQVLLAMVAVMATIIIGVLATLTTLMLKFLL